MYSTQSTTSLPFRQVFGESISIQHIQWKIIPDKTNIIVELISPLNSRVYKVFKHKSMYNRFAAVVRKECLNPRLTPGEVIIFEVPLTTLTRGMWAIPMNERNSLKPDILQDDNIWLDFTRENYKQMTINVMERRQIQPEHREYIERYYGDDDE